MQERTGEKILPVLSFFNFEKPFLNNNFLKAEKS